MMIEIIFVLVTVTWITRAIRLGPRGLIADESYELFELSLVQPDAAGCWTDIQLDTVAAYLPHR